MTDGLPSDEWSHSQMSLTWFDVLSDMTADPRRTFTWAAPYDHHLIDLSSTLGG